MSTPDFSQADLDGDGVNDAVTVDIDGDGTPESVVIPGGDNSLDVVSDTDSDGYYDTETVDTDGDNVADVIRHDVDEDGVVDSTEYDYDGDGQVDAIEVAGSTLVLDDSGHVTDVIDEDTSTDTSNDVADPTSADTTDDPTSVDTSDDPVSVDAPDDPVSVDTTMDVPVVVDPSAEPSPDVEPTATDPDELERDQDAQVWFNQAEDGYCAPSSVAMIVAEYSHESIPDESEFVQRAIDLDLIDTNADGDSWAGMTIEHTKDLLESYGVQATVATGDINSLDEYLDKGYNAIAYIDSSEVWEGQGKGVVDHAVVVSSIENGMVYLDDPGTPDGRLEAVPVDVFEKAWSVGHHAMVITENPDGIEPTPGVGTEVFDRPVDTDDISVVDLTSTDPSTEAEAEASEPSDTDEAVRDAISASRGTLLLPIVIDRAEAQAWLDAHV